MVTNATPHVSHPLIATPTIVISSMEEEEKVKKEEEDDEDDEEEKEEEKEEVIHRDIIKQYGNIIHYDGDETKQVQDIVLLCGKEMEKIQKSISILQVILSDVDLPYLHHCLQLTKHIQDIKDDISSTLSDAQAFALFMKVHYVELSDISTGYFAVLPIEVILHIISFLTPQEILTSVVTLNHMWNTLANDPSLWKLMYRKWFYDIGDGIWRSYTWRSYMREYMIDHEDDMVEDEGTIVYHHPSTVLSKEDKTMSTTPLPLILPSTFPHWKSRFRIRYQLENNWMQGKCSVVSLYGPHRFYCLCYVEDYISSHLDDYKTSISEIRRGKIIGGVKNDLQGCYKYIGPSQKEEEKRSTSYNAALWAGNAKGMITMWTLDMCNSYKSAHLLHAHSSAVNCIQYTNNRLFSCSCDNTIKMWGDVESAVGPLDYSLKISVHSEPVQMIHIDDGNILYSCSLDNTIKSFDLNHETCINTMTAEAGVRCIQVSHNSIMGGDSSGHLSRWDTRTNGLVWSLHAGIDKIMCLQHDERTLITTGDVNTTLIRGEKGEGEKGIGTCFPLVLFDVRKVGGGPIHHLLGHTDRIWFLHFRGNRLLSGSRDHSVRVWHIPNQTTSQGGHYVLGNEEQQHLNSVYWLYHSPSRLITASADHSVKIWDFSVENNH